MNEHDELEFLRVWIKHGIGCSYIEQGKINQVVKAIGYPVYVAYDSDGCVFVDEWPKSPDRPELPL